ncbi:hypothetical protein GLOTRDRAFT_75671 [Gloeophyllum trabeum ATCC 11539]|uniref:CxC1-like cysteine cluster associated with KDZ transposases domain-containing protein n=1 Tax=Gloeophyllum trabeum (strain ATCC 11539 / FP-39264 / Madison 617) TaxID=670483 RepID=S7RRG2_GLOTA|nr:uncharacterized protein GLOTRDRAFT_75671 [Gloeophyllum trabeum ATCC 11539]EPQ55524.1 hypothetical protein GLOTRDRAFT_75671 [Gloeophyllum trabeum ATCC 11539]
MKRFKGMSKASSAYSFKGRLLQKQDLRPRAQAQRRQQAAQERANLIKEMSSENRTMVHEMDLDAGDASPEQQELYDAAFNTMPPGEEGFDLSHEGGEHEVFEEFVHHLQNITGVRRVDYRDRRNRVELRTTQWNEQIDVLVNAYLEYSQQEQDGLVCEPAGADEGGDAFGIEVIDIFHRRYQTFIPTPGEAYTNATLLRYGYIGCSPVRPSVAISLRTLAVYRQTHRVCPRLSIQAEVKKSCHLHQVPYRRYLCELFTIAYDIYIEILHCVDGRIRTAMQRDQPNSELLNACPACMYKLEDEPPLEYSMMCEMDGNNSLKRIDAALRERQARTDTRRPRGPFWVGQEEVDGFKDDVKDDSADPDDDWEEESDSDPVATCIERWRNAGPEQRKKMFKLFDEAGIFVVACRHGVVVLVCDIVRSGELAKYGLAMVNRLVDMFGSRICIGYDIGCAFEGTVSRSSIADKACESLLRFVVGSFHGHAHNRGCQLRWHPLYVRGTGRSDFEGCERVFSASNALAAGTRHASRFHRHQAIDEHFAFWNLDKYASMSTFLLNHYREAQHVIDNHPLEIKEIQRKLAISDDNCLAYIRQEREYLQGLKKEPPDDTLRFDYVEALEHLEKCCLDDARGHLNRLNNTPALPNLHKSLVNASRSIRSAETKYHNAETTAAQLEKSLQLEMRWTSDHSEFRAIKEKLKERKYQRALDELERLVVQRLFELSKLNMSGTGMYNLFASDAIRQALRKYNTLASTHTPARPQLSWTDIVEYSFLGEFELLRHSRADIREAHWAQPSHREVTLKVLQLERAKEEVIRVNVEARRLRTFIHDETLAVHKAISRVQSSDPLLAAEIRKRWALQEAVNSVHIARLDRLALLPGMSGSDGLSVRIGTSQDACAMTSDIQTSVDPVIQEVLSGDAGGDGIQDDEELSRNVEGLVDFIEAVTD